MPPENPSASRSHDRPHAGVRPGPPGGSPPGAPGGVPPGPPDGVPPGPPDGSPPGPPGGRPPGRPVRTPATHGDPAVGLGASADDARSFEADINAMSSEFPQLVFSERDGVGCWRGVVQSVDSLDDVELLLDDIEHQRDAWLRDGSLCHRPSCTSHHDRHGWMEGLRGLDREYTIEVRAYGGKTVPRAFLLEPALKAPERHVWRDGAMCPFLNSEGWYDHRRDTVADFMPYTLLWLLKREVFKQSGHWPGPEHDSAPGYHLSVVGRSDPCWCGSGKMYRRCHLRKDARNARSRGHRRR